MPAAGSEETDDGLIADQRTYYARRAPEYDEWWQRQGRYDRGVEAQQEWDAQVETVAQALAAFDASGDVLELAGGTGWWSARLAATAGHLTVVDASPETLALNRSRVGERTNVRYVVADLFDWTPERTFDVVFFSFWLSHVPRERFGAFWELVGRCTGSLGRVFFIDSRGTETFPLVEPHLEGERGDVQQRTLNDGSSHRVVKIFYEPAELTRRLAEEGWDASVEGTPLFIYGSARPLGVAGAAAS